MAAFTAQAPWALGYTGQLNYFGATQLATPEVYTVVPWPAFVQASINQSLWWRGIQVKVWNPGTGLWELAVA
jgi:hypothetical protein